MICPAAALAVWNIVVFAMYGLDKRKAKRASQRISERTLLASAALMGGMGALLGMHVFRHKTRHVKFRAGVPLLLILNIAAMLLAVYAMGARGMPLACA